MANNIVPTPQPSQPLTEKGDRCNSVWWKWFSRLQMELTKFLPALGSANQVLGVNAGGTANEYKTLTGTANRITITHSVGGVTFTTPQDTHTGASPTFAGLTDSGLTAKALVYADTNKLLSSLGLMDGQLAIGSTGNAPVAGAITGTANRVTVTLGAGSIALSGPQDLAAASSPTFTGLTLSSLLDISGASAGQIKFPATQNSSADANTLDDYEEAGTFTPGLTFGGGATGITYSVQIGEYTKVGNAVLLYFGISLSAKGSSTGAVGITGMPFTAKNISNLRPNNFLRVNNLTAGTPGAIYGVLIENTAGLIPQSYDSATGVTSTLTDAAYTNTTVNQMTLHYFTA